jgi:hypothetical protein
VRFRRSETSGLMALFYPVSFRRVPQIACNGVAAGRLPCLHDIVERPEGIRQIVQEILLLPRFRTMLCA